MNFNREGMKKIGDRLLQLLQEKVTLKIVGCLPKYNFKLYNKEGEPHKGTLHKDVVSRIDARYNVLDFDILEQELLLPMVDALAKEINLYCFEGIEYYAIPLTPPPKDSLSYTNSTKSMAIRVKKDFNLKNCSNELHMDIAFIEKDIYDQLYRN